MKPLFTTYRYPFLCLLGAFLAAIAFFILALHLNDSMWFARGGSVVCLLAIAAEYGLLQIQQEVLNNRVAGLGTLSGPKLKNLDVPPPYQRLKISAHIIGVNGTFIWGFGDLLVKQVCSA